jgi:hypothetical protein
MDRISALINLRLARLTRVQALNASMPAAA